MGNQINNGFAANIGGGKENRINSLSSAATVGGGGHNEVFGPLSTIGGGFQNRIDGSLSTIGGGSENFAWADSTDADFASTANNQFAIRRTGGVRLSDDTPHLSFGSDTRQMLNLFGTTYGIWVQESTFYQRSNFRFSWFLGGTHSDTKNSPGAGGSVLMTLTSAGLTVNGTCVSESDWDAKERFESYRTVDVIQLVVSGVGFGVALTGLVFRLLRPRR